MSAARWIAAAIWLALAIAGLAVYAIRRLADWDGLDQPFAWSGEPRRSTRGPVL